MAGGADEGISAILGRIELMIASLAAASLSLAIQAEAPSAETAFMSALAAGDAPAVEAMLAEDATIMHERSGPPEPSTAAAIAAFLRDCQGEVLFDVVGDGPGAMAYTTLWSCGARGEAQMLLWTRDSRIVWVQLFKLEPAVEEAR
jgi:ketosteroid isomerase-like protein